MDKPTNKPNNPCFSSGPCAKRPGWSLEELQNACLGRSHRSAPGKAKLKDVIETHRELLRIPDDYRIGIVPASDTGAVEMALWSVLGPRAVDVFAWESFSEGWLKDITGQLPLEKSKVNQYTAPYGQLPDLAQANKDHDTVFVWNGTTSGVRVPNADWIADDRKGLTICDATSAVFAYDMPWDKLDITTWSWQKVLGGEAAHGMIVLSPHAVERLESYSPPWPMPKIFRMTKGGKINEGIFQGATINTPSMLAVEDCLDALNWIKSIGGVNETVKRSEANFKAIEEWLNKTQWAEFLAEVPQTRSHTSICLTIADSAFQELETTDQLVFIKDMAKLLDNEGVAFDIAGYRDAPAGLRIWGGATVETSDIEALTAWLDWAFAETKEINKRKAA